MTRTIFSGIKPTGRLTLGNYLGALQRFVATQHQRDTTCLFSIVDLHALTVPHDPDRLRALSFETAALYLAAGLDPRHSILFRQSAVPAHSQLAYLLECTAHVGELSRMIQYKEKGRGQPATRTSLFTYPVLMSADILLYRTTQVPVGDDQRQHMELTADLAARFNQRYGEVFVVPAMVPAPVAARVMDLSDPTRKMSKDDPDDAPGAIRLLDPPDVVHQKVRRAVTDSAAPAAAADSTGPGRSAGVTNLVEILAACTGHADPAALATEYTSYAVLKRDVTEAVNTVLKRLQARYAELADDRAMVEPILADGAERARDLAAPVLAAAEHAIGLVRGGPEPARGTQAAGAV